MPRLNLKSGDDLILQVVGIRNKYMFAPCLTLRAVSALTEHRVCFVDVAWPSSPLRDGAFRLFFFFFLSVFLSCPKKNVIVMVPLTRGDGKTDNKLKAS